ncbi:hypothetical protein LTR91_025665 [Friedmanniomyces endolithicus]|uniref:Uncharacterized protein n=2 Tax=Dothideomycetidae TaxID=451867 RepID=A0A4U0UWG2_9PEZI|nr:hypothetical protein LTS09_015639 [Friedmanniomyces endolithicus]KAK5148048.1 hypothetical protein LTR32_000564 [Rachicladosporium monterosium]KAK0342541.1 hypothetical protein LTR94_021879 [Friedmanniomyces endolithicus]KAK0769085.1 hypothetical protein LTR38_017977 [Friedmanniomyces endolithicus]KAK0770022.1 hypothetical protein LTR59_016713 [Friedmanniomyces endolithicus]
MLQAGKWGIPSCARSKTRKSPATQLSDDEIRRRILANATVLFPSAAATNAYEIVYGSRPRLTSSRDATSGCDDPPWQYAMLVRRSPSGEYAPLIRGVAWSTQAPWSMVLQGLLDATACAVHKRFGSLPMPEVEMGEELPLYQAGAGTVAGLVVVPAES